ncbi:MAG TPA: response regulator transcription factor [Candidatus Limnocylindria bacterium]|nr:response regulator transcription factor [Candidatus Limnocylindria bacterium]
MSDTPIAVLIVDDHPVFRRGMRALLESVGDTTVVGEASAVDEAVGLVDELRPNVVLMDVKMPGQTGIEATRRITAAHPEVGVLMVTMLEEDDAVLAAMRAGARGYIVKGADQDEVLRAVRGVASGDAVFGRAVAQRLMRFFSVPSSAASQAFPDLTQREGEILGLLADGKSNAAIAQRLGLSPKTVRNHVSNVLNKLQVADRGEAIVRARQAGLGEH